LHCQFVRPLPLNSTLFVHKFGDEGMNLLSSRGKHHNVFLRVKVKLLLFIDEYYECLESLEILGEANEGVLTKQDEIVVRLVVSRVGVVLVDSLDEGDAAIG
jgi:hypothetical protein